MIRRSPVYQRLESDSWRVWTHVELNAKSEAQRILLFADSFNFKLRKREARTLVVLRQSTVASSCVAGSVRIGLHGCNLA